MEHRGLPVHLGARPGAGRPAGLFAARRQTDGAAQFVVAQGSLAFVLGAPGGSGEGELQVWTEADQWGNP
jgi:hypothetical protein